MTPDFEFYDLTATTAPNDSRNQHTDNIGGPIPPVADAAQVLREKTKFCAFLFRNFRCATRNRFLEILSAHMRVEAGGRTLRSVRSAPLRQQPTFLEAAVDFYRPYKFVIAFENSLALDYASEKVWTAIHADAVPIYWGNPRIANYFNPERFINAFDFDNLESLVRHVMRVHQDDELYLRYLSAPARTLRQDGARFTNCRYFVNFPDLERSLRAERSALFSFYQGLTEKHRKGFLHRYIRLMTGRMLPLAQRRMFHRECLSRFAYEAFSKIVQERWFLVGRLGRHRISTWHIWPDPAFYEHVDMRGQLDVKD